MNTRTRIKICGITDLHEALDIVSLGVDALGFIFVKDSPRNIDPEKAREIIRKTPPFVDVVGVFMNEDPDLVNDIAQYCGLTFAQLHGSEPPKYCRSITCRLLKAFRVKTTTKSEELAPYDDLVAGFLLDTYQNGVAGGTGKTFDWQLANSLSFSQPLILAGGLTPDNIKEAIEVVRPFAVDVNSGVEREPGRKDVSQVERLIKQVQEADLLR